MASNNAVYTKPSDLAIKEELAGVRKAEMVLHDLAKEQGKMINAQNIVLSSQGGSIRGLAGRVQNVSKALWFVLGVTLVGWGLGLIALAWVAKLAGVI